MNGLILLLLFAGEAIRGCARQAAVVLANVNRRHRRAQVLGQELEDIAAQHAQRQLPQNLLSQFTLAIAQPGHFLQTLGIDFLQPEVFAVSIRQRQQIPAADIGKNCADDHHEYQIKGDGKNGTARDFSIAVQSKLLLHLHGLIIFGTDLVGDAFATSGQHRRLIIAVGAPQRDHVLGERIPLLLQRRQTSEPIQLRRVVVYQFLQPLQLGEQQRLGNLIGVEKMLITRQQKTAHAGFHVYRQFH